MRIIGYGHNEKARTYPGFFYFFLKRPLAVRAGVRRFFAAAFFGALRLRVVIIAYLLPVIERVFPVL